ncbi:MAG: DUF1810 domain-containing protein [Candidatus Omnitrophica bacterium]|nr:DUF1810 domain-containing protein [Candidatus Omnitrophota bacterium]
MAELKNSLERFVEAQAGTYRQALDEIRSGCKRSHWMWFIFPQMKGLGHSSTANYYAIQSLDEAREYLAHPVLGKRLKECAEALMALENLTVSEIFGYPDDLKLRSSMTLFSLAAGPGSVFEKVLEKYFNGQKDSLTLNLLG